MPAGSIQLITQTEYARRRGCSETAVRKAIAAGRIALIDGKIDPVAADVQWAANTRVRAGSRPADDANLQLAGGQAGAAASSAAARQAEERAADGDAYWQVKARRERAEADIAELKLAELRGELVRAAHVRAAQARMLAGLRDSLLQLPARLAPVLAAESDQLRCHDALQAELHAVLRMTALGSE